jgi:hypothetical protein
MEPIPLATADIRPIIPAALRDRVLDALMQSVTAYSPVQVDRNRLRANLETNFDRICDGVMVDLRALASKWLANGRMTSSDVYLIAHRLELELRAIGISVRVPELRLSEELKRRLDREVRDAHAGPFRFAQPRKHVRIGDLLVSYGLITSQQLEHALRTQKLRGGRLGTVLVGERFIDSATLGHFLSVQLGIDAVDSAQLLDVPAANAGMIPKRLAVRHRAVALSQNARVLTVAMIDPTDLAAIQDLAFATGHQIVVRIAPESCVGQALERLYGENPVHQGFGAIDLDDSALSLDIVRDDDRWTVLDPNRIDCELVP